MPVLKEYHTFHDGKWVGILGEDVVPPEPPPPPPPGGVPGPVPTFEGAGAGKGGGVAVLPVWPAHAVGEVGLLFIQTAAQPVGNLAALLALGWAHAPNSPQYLGTPGAAGSVGLTVLWKRAASTAEPAPDVGDSGSHQICRIAVIQGCFPTGSPFDGTSAGNTLATPSTVVAVPPSVTNYANALVFAVVAEATDTLDNQNAGSSNASLTNFAGMMSFQHTAGVGGGFLVFTGSKVSPGAYSQTDISLVTASAQIRSTFALRPTLSAAPPPTSGFRTMVSGQGLDSSLWGTQPVPDIFQVNTSGSSVVGSGGWLDLAATKGSCMICRVTGGNATSKNPNGSFSPALWKANFDAWKAEVVAVAGGLTKLRAAVADGRWRALYALDDFTTPGPQDGGNAYLYAVTFEEIEDICRWVKVDSPSPWPWMPLVARGPNKYLRSAASLPGAGTRINGVRQYQYLDAGWGQARPTTDPNPVTYYNTEVLDGLACALGFVGGINMLDRGRGVTPGWGCQSGGLAGKCSMSPTEIQQWGDAALANPNVSGFNIYSYNFGVAYWNLSEIQAAMQYVYNASVGRSDGPINVRGDLTPA